MQIPGQSSEAKEHVEENSPAEVKHILSEFIHKETKYHIFVAPIIIALAEQLCF